MRVARIALLAVASVIALAAPAQAQTIPPTGVGSATVVPIQVTGPAANRFNLVIAGDGYTEAEQDKFMQQVDKHLNIMWSIEPYKTYRNYINVYAIKIISAESGIDCDPNLTSPLQEHRARAWRFWGGCNAGSVQRLVTVNNTVLSRYTALAPGVSQRLAIAQLRHLRRRGRHLRDRDRRQRALGADQPARDRPLARRPAGRVRLLPARSARRLLHRRRADARSITRC